MNRLLYILLFTALSVILFSSLIVLFAPNPDYMEINYLPEGYIGKVAIIFDQKDGAEIEYIGKRRVYRIPSCGILKTKFQVTDVSFIDSETNKATIYVYLDKHGTITDTLKVFTIHDIKYNQDRVIKDFGNKIGVTDLGFMECNFGDTEYYENIQVYAVDTLKNIPQSGFPLMEKEDLEKCK